MIYLTDKSLTIFYEVIFCHKTFENEETQWNFVKKLLVDGNHLISDLLICFYALPIFRGFIVSANFVTKWLELKHFVTVSVKQSADLCFPRLLIDMLRAYWFKKFHLLHAKSTEYVNVVKNVCQQFSWDIFYKLLKKLFRMNEFNFFSLTFFFYR
jgi:hypothetical protein